MHVKIINNNILVHENEIYTRRKVKGCETGHFDLSNSERERLAKIRKMINDNHPMRHEFKAMLEEKLDERK